MPTQRARTFINGLARVSHHRTVGHLTLLASTLSTHTLVMALSLSVAALGFNAPLPAAVASRSA
eukprot:1699159-Pleurochrysis_carterae.AAC.1